jgi:radical SAM superfamily enzyme YgiQ (UPF0313 family)
MASRGCPSKCIYCNKSVFGTQTRFRKPEKIIEEIKNLHEKYGIEEIFFQDDTFNLNRKWIEEILNLIIKEKLNISINYRVAFRANKNLVDEDLLKLAKEANITSIFYGVESGNQQMLNRMRKSLTIEEIKRAFKLAHDFNIETIAAFIIGLPGENIATIKDTIKLWKEIKPSYSGFTIATPFPGTEFQKIIINNNNLLNKNYDEYRLGGSYVCTKELSRNELEFYATLFMFAQNHQWMYNLPYFSIGSNKVLCNILVNSFRFYRYLKEKI